jgi:hypothetical protein
LENLVMFDRLARALRRVSTFVIFLAALMLGSRAARASTPIAGGNVINQVWTPAGSPYIVAGDITIPIGATLTIQPGVDVQFASMDGQGSGLDSTRIEVTVLGTLNATGTAASPITFKAQSGSGAGIWYGIVINAAAAAATISNAVIQNANLGVRNSSLGTVPVAAGISGSVG